MNSLRTHVETLCSPDDYLELKQIVPHVLYTVYLISQESKHYGSARRLTLMLASISNEVITQTHQYIQPGELFGGEPDESNEKVKSAIKMLDFFRECYTFCKNKSLESSNPWNFDPSIAFSRFDTFYTRVSKLAYLFDTLIEFNKIEKIEIGNSKGKILNSHLIQVFTEFQARMSTFVKVKYDMLDLTVSEFNDDYEVLHSAIEDLERRIGTIICQAFDDCPCLYSCFRMVECFSGLLGRSIINRDFEPKYLVMLELFSKDITEVNEIFIQYRDSPPIHSNMAPITGALSWAKELKDRITANMERFNQLSYPIMHSDSGKKVADEYNVVLSKLDAFVKANFEKWAVTVEATSSENLSKPLLARQDAIVRVNFDPKIVALLREVHYLYQLSMDPPGKAAEIYHKSDVYRKYIFQLDHLCSVFNNINSTVLAVEKPLIEARFTDIESKINDGLLNMTWLSENVEEYINNLSIAIQGLANILQSVKSNISQTQKILKGWSASPFFDRKDVKKPLNLEDRETRFEAVQGNIKRDGQTIHDLVEQIMKFFEADDQTEAWKQYLIFVDQMVTEGFVSAIRNSLSYLAENMDRIKANEAAPFLEARIELENENLLFTPEMTEDADNSLGQILHDIVENILNSSALVGRVADISILQQFGNVESQKPALPAVNEESAEAEAEEESEEAALQRLRQKEIEDQTYLGHIVHHGEIQHLKTTIIRKTESVMDDSQAFRHNMSQYAYLWLVSRFRSISS